MAWGARNLISTQIQTGVSGWSQESRPFWYVPSVAEKAAVAFAVSLVAP